ncbi:hypothetical protein [Devosia sp. SL43]|uniref:hypothetical protein n=1 Tax=Devosia sp. SL43 TaxID=2806348 RepID=UPI001F211043|nr:hypothetical protein [Devosia sp. SL43]UJW86388.1 hypothetical protein IM737_03685 [Devosia sp. SL43]
MKLILSVAVSCALVVATVIFVLDFANESPSTAILDADIALVRSEIEAVEIERGRFSGGAIESIFDARLGILQTTVSMLEQKRMSLLRRVDLNYTIDGTAHEPNETSILALEADLAAAKSDRDRYQAEADLYSGGLVQTLALVNVATSELSISQANLAIMAERHGFVFDWKTSSQTSVPIGQTVVTHEEDAL